MTRKPQKKLMKILTLICSATLLVCLTIVGTVAYLTATTTTVTNTFTFGNVSFATLNGGLDEADVDVYGVVETDEKGDPLPRVTANSYKLIPGHTYTKDPTVHMGADSENAWLFVKVENGIKGIEADLEDINDTIADQMTAKGWTQVAGTTNIYSYKDVVGAEKKIVDIVVFDSFTLSDTVDLSKPEYAKYKTATITIQAYAVQADGFATAADAWKAAPLATWTGTTAE